jgi:hypothetical protein
MNLQETIKRVLRETEISIQARRRSDTIKKLLDIILINSLPCRYDDIEEFASTIFNDVRTYFIVLELKGLNYEEVEEYIKKYLIDDIKRYYIDSQEDC